MVGKNIEKIKQFDQISLSDSCKAILLGSILGDGSLKKQKGYKNARISIRHSEVQTEYFYWKVAQLKEIANKKSVQIQKPTGFSKKKKLLFQSKSDPELTLLYNLTYKGNKLKIKRKWLNNLSPLALAIWWMDDGSLIGQKKNKGVLCTDGFELEQVKLISKYLKIVWKVENTVWEYKRERKGEIKKYPRIWINKKEALKQWIEIIKPYIHKSMKYKIDIERKQEYKNSITPDFLTWIQIKWK